MTVSHEQLRTIAKIAGLNSVENQSRKVTRLENSHLHIDVGEDLGVTPFIAVEVTPEGGISTRDVLEDLYGIQLLNFSLFPSNITPGLQFTLFDANVKFSPEGRKPKKATLTDRDGRVVFFDGKNKVHVSSPSLPQEFDIKYKEPSLLQRAKTLFRR